MIAQLLEEDENKRIAESLQNGEYQNPAFANEPREEVKEPEPPLVPEEQAYHQLIPDRSADMAFFNEDSDFAMPHHRDVLAETTNADEI